MNHLGDVEAMRYAETFELPKFKASLDRLLSKCAYDAILTTIHDIEISGLGQLVERATREGNAVLIERGYNGFAVTLWKD